MRPPRPLRREQARRRGRRPDPRRSSTTCRSCALASSICWDPGSRTVTSPRAWPGRSPRCGGASVRGPAAGRPARHDARLRRRPRRERGPARHRRAGAARRRLLSTTSASGRETPIRTRPRPAPAARGESRRIAWTREWSRPVRRDPQELRRHPAGARARLRAGVRPRGQPLRACSGTTTSRCRRGADRACRRSVARRSSGARPPSARGGRTRRRPGRRPAGSAVERRPDRVEPRVRRRREDPALVLRGPVEPARDRGRRGVHGAAAGSLGGDVRVHLAHDAVGGREVHDEVPRLAGDRREHRDDGQSDTTAAAGVAEARRGPGRVGAQLARGSPRAAGATRSARDGGGGRRGAGTARSASSGSRRGMRSRTP